MAQTEGKITFTVDTDDQQEAERRVGELLSRAAEIGINVDKAKLTDASGEERKLQLS